MIFLIHKRHLLAAGLLCCFLAGMGVVLWRGKDTLTLYSIDNGERYEVPYEEAGSDATGNRNFPIALTDDGRILVTDGYIDRSA